MKTELIRIVLFICFDKIFVSDKSVRDTQLYPTSSEIFNFFFNLLMVIITVYIQNFAFPCPFWFFFKLILLSIKWSSLFIYVSLYKHLYLGKLQTYLCSGSNPQHALDFFKHTTASLQILVCKTHGDIGLWGFVFLVNIRSMLRVD